MKNIITILVFFCSSYLYAQKEFHVFPKDAKTIKGTSNGDGSIDHPWDLQTALSQTSERVNGGDIIWLHKGIYTGNYKSFLNSNNSKHITVSAYKDDDVILNGNTDGKVKYVLYVGGGKVTFKNFEITFIGDFSRNESEEEFKAFTGISHNKGKDCNFQNLVIHNIPGSGIGSWKATAATVIEDCLIYNNGYQGKIGHGVGIYVQNQSDKNRIIRNNIIFNNYYKGIEVWSATSGTKREFVKNVILEDNIIFNNGNPSGKHVDNIIVASNDKDGINVAKNIQVRNNVLYHNVDFSDVKNFGHGPSLTLGFNSSSLVEDITVENNIIIGKNNALNLTHLKSLDFKNNTVYAGYVHFNKSSLPSLESGIIRLNNNKYFTRKPAALRILKHKDYQLTDWQKAYGIDHNSEWKQLKDFEIEPVLKISKLKTSPNQFNVAVLQKDGQDVAVDFSKFGIEEGTAYKIIDVENRSKVISSERVNKQSIISFSMSQEAFEMPLHNTKATKSSNNFGVFRIEFSDKVKKKGLFQKLFGWLF